MHNYLISIYKKSGYGFRSSLCVETIGLIVGLSLSSCVLYLWIVNIPFGFYLISKILKLKNETMTVDNQLVKKENLKKNKWFNLFFINN